jgi:hypothetical protein
MDKAVFSSFINTYVAIGFMNPLATSCSHKYGYVPQSLKSSQITTIALVPNFVFITFSRRPFSQ